MACAAPGGCAKAMAMAAALEIKQRDRTGPNMYSSVIQKSRFPQCLNISLRLQLAPMRLWKIEFQGGP